MKIHSTRPFEEYKCGGKEDDLRGNINFPYEADKLSGVRSWNMHDVDQIIYSSEFRRLADKLQLLPYEHPRKRTRLMHTLEVVRIAKEIAKNLGCNVELTEAIALGHDLGNSALGHAGNEVILKEYKVHHQEISALACEILSARYAYSENITRKLTGKKKMCYVVEPNSKIRYLTAEICDGKIEFPIQPEVLEGIKYHTKGHFPSTLEGQIVRHADNFAYIVQDIDDAFRAGIIKLEDYCKFATYNRINGKLWKNVNGNLNLYGHADLKGLYDVNTGVRVGTLITRFVEYHKHKKECGKRYKMISSKFVGGGEVPKLDLDAGLKFAINSVWGFISDHIHENATIKSIQKQYKHCTEQIIEIIEKEKWEIYTCCNRVIDESVSKKHGEKNIFEVLLYNPRFNGLKKDVQTAFILNNLSYPDIKEIISKYNRMGEVKKIHL